MYWVDYFELIEIVFATIRIIFEFVGIIFEFIAVAFSLFGCGLSKMVGPKKQYFWPRINILNFVDECQFVKNWA